MIFSSFFLLVLACRWCKAKPICRALADKNVKLAALDFAEPKPLTDEELIEVYKQSGLLVDWAKSIAGYLLAEALKGKDWEGYKLVRGRANRKWVDEHKAMDAILEQGFGVKEVLNYKIKGIGDLEKLVGKTVFCNLDLTIKPEGKPTLVEESDKRQAINLNSAIEDFDI